MKFILFSFILFVSSQQCLHTAYAANPRFSPNSIIHQLFEMFRNLMLTGDLENDLPIADPYNFSLERFTFSGFINGEVNITSGTLAGLAKFTVKKFEFNKDDLSVLVEISIPKLKLESDYYEMKGNIYEAVPIAGTGIVFVSIQDIIVNSKIYLKQSDNGKSVLIDRLENTHFTIDKIVSFTEYDKNIDAILNALIADLLPSRLSQYSRYIAATYQGRLVDLVNPMLCNYDSWGILEMIL